MVIESARQTLALPPARREGLESTLVRAALLSGGRAFRPCLTSLFLMTMGVISPAVFGAETGTFSFTVDSPRAIEAAILQLMSRYGYPITYEDAPLEYSGDLQDVTEERHIDLTYLKNHGRVRETIPVDERLTVNLKATNATNEFSTLEGAIEQLLRDHTAANRGGRFRLERGDGILHIVPAEVRNSQGMWVKRESILDSIITIPPEERSMAVMLEAICKAVGAASNTEVVIGHLPNTLGEQRSMAGASQERARDVLMSVLQPSNRRLTWMLDYTLPERKYYLSIGVVPDQRSSTSSQVKSRCQAQSVFGRALCELRIALVASSVS